MSILPLWLQILDPNQSKRVCKTTQLTKLLQTDINSKNAILISSENIWNKSLIRERCSSVCCWPDHWGFEPLLRHFYLQIMLKSSFFCPELQDNNLPALIHFTGRQERLSSPSWQWCRAAAHTVICGDLNSQRLFHFFLNFKPLLLISDFTGAQSLLRLACTFLYREFRSQLWDVVNIPFLNKSTVSRWGLTVRDWSRNHLQLCGEAVMLF